MYRVCAELKEKTEKEKRDQELKNNNQKPKNENDEEDPFYRTKFSIDSGRMSQFNFVPHIKIEDLNQELNKEFNKEQKRKNIF